MAGRTKAAQGEQTAATAERKIAKAAETVPSVRPATERPLRPAQCRTYMKRVLAQEFRGIVEGFVQGAKSGSCQHVKLATELLGPQRKAKSSSRSGKAVLSQWLEEMEREE